MTTVRERQTISNPYESLTTGELVKQLSDEVSRLVRDELRLATLELSHKGRQARRGAGMFGGAGVCALYGGAALVAAAVILIAQLVTPWVAAVIVGVALLIVAAVLGLTGKRQVAEATPPLPKEAIRSMKADVEAVREVAHR